MYYSHAEQLIFIAAKFCCNIYQSYLPDFDQIITNKEFDVKAGIVHAKTGSILVFAGSNSILDWKINFSTYRQKIGKVGVHAGYNKAYQSVRSLIDQQLKNEKTIVVTGHSAGGALAQLSALHLAQRGAKVTCITFGSPRVGSKNFIDLCDGIYNHYRIINRFDLIRLFPFFGYKSGGKKIIKDFYPCPHNIENYTIACNNFFNDYKSN